MPGVAPVSGPARRSAIFATLSLVLAGLLAGHSAAAQQGMTPTEFVRQSAERTRALNARLAQLKTAGPGAAPAIKRDVIAPLDQLVGAGPARTWQRAVTRRANRQPCGCVASRLVCITTCKHSPDGSTMRIVIIKTR